MKLLADSPAGLRAVCRALVAMPQGPRRFALERVAFCVITPGVNGWVLPRARLDSCDWVVVLAGDRENIEATAAHEVAHAFLAHDGDGGPEHEREAEALAGSWGVVGADPEGAAGRYSSPETPAPRAIVTADSVRLECERCDTPCSVLSPTVASLPALIAVECLRCAWFTVQPLADLVSCSCGKRATVTWYDSATPSNAIAEWRCSCGVIATRSIASAPVEPKRPMALIVPRVDGTLDFYLRHALQAITMQNGHPAPDGASGWWARRQLGRALAEMNGDGAGVRQFVQEALEALQQGERGRAVEALTHALEVTPAREVSP